MNKDKIERNELQKALIMAMKELGEISECLIKEDMYDHWIKELSDLSALSIKPMLELAGLSFENAVEIGLRRKHDKLQGNKKEYE